MQYSSLPTAARAADRANTKKVVGECFMEARATNVRVVHATSAHPRDDIRIFRKECCSLADAGYEVVLIVADGLGEETRNGVRVLDVGKPRNRLGRMVASTRAIMKLALRLQAEIYHIHDPELLTIGLALKDRGRRVIFDAHENVPLQILSKAYIPSALRRPISLLFEKFERRASRKIDAVVAATPSICQKFAENDVSTISVCNFPVSGEFDPPEQATAKENEICYIGGMSAIRGVREIVQAVGLSGSGVRLNLAGNYADPDFHDSISQLPGWSKVNALGHLNRSALRGVLARSFAGVVTFHPSPNHIDAQPNKMFEYMAAALPVIASDFPLWREIVESNHCGICVDPLDPSAIANAIEFLAKNPEVARDMGNNGRRAVEQRYNWRWEREKLLKLYDELLSLK